MDLLRSEKGLQRGVTLSTSIPSWVLDRLEAENFKQNITNKGNNNNKSNNKSIGYIVLPYMWGFWENFKDICSMHGIQSYLKGNRTLLNILVTPKGKDCVE